jgi:hypothetical protein
MFLPLFLCLLCAHPPHSTIVMFLNTWIMRLCFEKKLCNLCEFGGEPKLLKCILKDFHDVQELRQPKT